MHPQKTLVLAIGNILRTDDGVGAAVIEHLQAYPPIPDVEWLDAGTPGFELVLTMQGYQRVIVVDAADMGLAPGTWRTFTPNEIRLQARDMYLRGTLHYAGLAEALSLGEAMNILPDHIQIVGIQPADIDWHMGLTEAVAAVVPEVAKAIYAMVQAAPVTA